MAPHRPIGEHLVEAGAITPSQLQAALRYQAANGGSIGAIVVDLGFTSMIDVQSALVAQRHEDRDRGRLGDILVRRGLATRGQIARAVEVQSRTGQPIGEVLVDDGVLSRTQLDDALAEQRHRTAGSGRAGR